MTDVRCERCGQTILRLQDGCIIIQARHHGEKHVNVVSLRRLQELNEKQEPMLTR